MKQRYPTPLLVIGGLVGLALAAIVLVYIVTGLQMMVRYDVTAARLDIPTGKAAIEHGRHVAWAISKCVDCHDEDLGGKIYSEGSGLGRLATANLTKGTGGIGSDYNETDWVRAIRHGVRQNGTPLLFMPAHEFYSLSDNDLSALIAYLKSLPPVDRQMPRTWAGLTSRWQFLFGDLVLIPAKVINHSPPRPESPEVGINKEYGEYLINVGGCRKCHGHNLRGGPIPFEPAGTVLSANLSPGGDLDYWEIEDFFNALRKGKEPDGGNLESVMPWKYTAGLTDAEITAMWLYLQSL